MAQRRLRRAELGGSAGETRLLGHRHEGVQVDQSSRRIDLASLMVDDAIYNYECCT
jgi:hypothetical protein